MATFELGDTRLKTRIVRTTNQFTIVSLAKLVDLPLEVLVEILLLLEWKDILRIRQTCQWLYDASFARPILSLVQWYSATTQPRPFFPEKPLALHTNRELEHLILRWQSGKAGGALLREPKERVLSIPEDDLQSVCLLQGGRWFLFGAPDGSVKYHDLNALGKISEAVTLVPSHFEQDANAVVALSGDMDPGVEYMKFNLGIMTKQTAIIPFRLTMLEVNRITPYWDANGQVKGLRAERLACFREEYDCRCHSFTLGGRHVAYSLCPFEQTSTDWDGEGQNIAIVDWTLADSTSLVYPRRLICHRRARWMAILPYDRLLCHIGIDILLFDLRDAPVTTLLPTQWNQPTGQYSTACCRLH